MTASGAPSSAPGYRGMLALVIFLGALIMLGLGALVAGLILVGGQAREGAPFNATLDAPGAHIESAELDGNRILLKLSGGAKGEELVILDVTTGRVLGRIAINAK